MKPLTHEEIMNNALCIIDGHIVLFDMRTFKNNPEGALDGRSVAATACISESMAHLFPASLNLYQALLADNVDVVKLRDDITQLLVGGSRLQFSDVLPIINKLNDMLARQKLVLGCALYGGEAVAKGMGFLETDIPDEHPIHKTVQ